jgi:HK97 family phage major capsid protein/HK97 family phage prohead protease
MTEILLKRYGDYFLDGGKQIPKQNYRSLILDKAEVSSERTLELSVSSSAPYNRYWYVEELEHTESSIDLSRFRDGANVLFNHNRDDYIGVIESAWIEGNKLYNRIRFDTHELAERILSSVRAGIIRNVSIGYVVDELVLVKQTDEINTYRATKWTPLETSLVTVPADASVGVGRSYSLLGKRESLEKDETEVFDCFSSVASSQDTSKGKNVMSVETPQETWLKNERERSQQLLAAGKHHNCPDLAEKAIAEGWDIFRLRSEILEQQKVSQEPVAAVAPVGMSRKERQRYSVLKAIAYAAKQIPASEAGLELEVSKGLQERGNLPSPKGIYIDQAELVSYRATGDTSAWGDPRQRALPYETGVPAAAGNLIETDLLSERFIEQLYNESAFLNMGVTYLRDLSGNVEIPRESSFTTGYWVGEKQTIPEGEGTFDKISMSPKKLAVITKATFEMLQQTSIDLESLMRNRLLRGIALELDRTIGFGTGVGSQPLGIVSHPETRSITLGVNGGPLDWAALIAMQTQLFSRNANGSFGYIVNESTRGKLMTTLDQNTGGGRWIWQPNGMGNEGYIAGYRAHCSNQIPNNLSKGTANNLTAAFFGDFSNVLLGMWSGLDVMANPYSEFDKAIIQIRAMQLCDIELTRGDYFCCVTDVAN